MQATIRIMATGEFGVFPEALPSFGAESLQEAVALAMQHGLTDLRFERSAADRVVEDYYADEEAGR